LRLISYIQFPILCFTLISLQSCTAMQAVERRQQMDQEFVAARQLIAHGHLEEGLNKLIKLNNAYPENPEYRNELKLQREISTAKLINTAETDVQKNQLPEAEAIYKEVLTTTPSNQKAAEGLKKIENLQKHTTLMTRAQQAFSDNEFEYARELVRMVLAEDASNQDARRLFENLDEQAIEKINTAPKIKTAFKKPVSLEFNNVPIKSVFEYIGKAGSINFSFDREISDATLTSVILRDTPIQDAIQTILTTNQLGKKILNENTILIYPLSRLQDYQELYVRSFYLHNMDAKRAMKLISTVLNTKDIYIDEKLNTLVMRDTLESVKAAEKLIASQDLVEPEVMLEVEVMEVNRRNLEELGIKYPTQASVGVQGASGAPGRLTLAELKNFNSGLGVFTITDPVLALNLLQQDTDTNLLANPKIRVKNRDEAKIHVGDKVPVLTSVANSTGFVSQSISYIEVGIKLEVEPTILIQNQVSIKVKLEVSNITDQIQTASGVLAYTIGSRNANTTLQLKDGETQILAGLFKNDEQRTTNKVPGLSNLPLIGRLFTNNSNDKRKNEIVLLITPRILHNIVPVNSVYTIFPSGVRQAVDNIQSQPSGIQTNNAIAPAPVIVVTPAEEQKQNVTTDQSFAKEILKNDLYEDSRP